MPPARRAPRPALARSTGYRLIIPVLLVCLVVVALLVLILAGGVLFGVIP